MLFRRSFRTALEQGLGRRSWQRKRRWAAPRDRPRQRLRELPLRDLARCVAVAEEQRRARWAHRLLRDHAVIVGDHAPELRRPYMSFGREFVFPEQVPNG